MARNRELVFMGILLLLQLVASYVQKMNQESVVSVSAPVFDAPTANKTIVRPVIFMHGILDNPREPEFPSTYIPQKKPGTKVYVIKMYNRVESLTNLNRQLSRIIPVIKEIMANHTDTGVNLLCYSQGGVICRGAVEMIDNHNIHSLITLSSPLVGQYGVTSFIKPYLPSKDRKYMYEVFYTSVGQELWSVANYWNDPHHQDEFTDPKLDVLVAKLNNQTGHPDSLKYKSNFLRLSKLVVVGGPDDGVITPWQSALFGTYNQTEGVTNMTQQTWYKNDDFGLRTLDKAGKLLMFEIPGLSHIHWYRTARVYDLCVLPYL